MEAQSLTPTPPKKLLHPVHLLDSFLCSLDEIPPQSASNPSNVSNTPAPTSGLPVSALRQPSPQEERQRLLLRTADFLFGGYPGSLLEAALTVLDNAQCGAPAVRMIRSVPSGRIAFLVRGSSSHSSPTRNNYKTEPNQYLCLFESDKEHPGERSSDKSVSLEFYLGGACHCSCRSFYERMKADPMALCKHLLAVKLGPHLGCDAYVECVVSDREFAGLISSNVAVW